MNKLTPPRRQTWACAGLAVLLCFTAAVCLASSPRWDIVIHGGTVYDGSGTAPRRLDLGIVGDRIVALGRLRPEQARLAIDASGLAVSPGFINNLSWATESLLIDGRGMSDVLQGVTLEIFGEGSSMGPLNETMRQRMLAAQGEMTFDVPWSTLGEYLDHMVSRGVSPNVASFVGAATVRTHVLGLQNKTPNEKELNAMRALVDQAMREGALGVGSALIYAPGAYASTAELIALVEVAASYGGAYISHLRSEGDRLLPAINELIEIGRATGAHAEIYHLKVSGERNWPKHDEAIARIEAARTEGFSVAANMYTYTAGSTGFDAGMPPWIQEGGIDAWIKRLKVPALRQRALVEMQSADTNWENLLGQAGPAGTLLVGFKNPALRSYIGRTLSEVAEERGTSPFVTAMDLVVEDGSRVQVVYFLMSEDNVRAKVALPWMSFGSDAGAYAAALPFTRQGTHPRAYGNFTRLLGRYVREEKLISLTEAIRKLSALPAQKFKLPLRGRISPGYYADITVFDPAAVTDHATYANPHVYAKGVRHVVVNGQPVVLYGEHTGAKPGRVVRGPGWTGWQ